MVNVCFKGEESARFARFATIIISVFGSEEIPVFLTGREPLTSKYIDVKGKVKGAMNLGYRRHVEIKEDDTEKIYWAAGTNATSSIATITITFSLSDAQKDLLVAFGKKNLYFIPTLSTELNLSELWVFVDHSIDYVSVENAKRLLDIISNNECNDYSLKREAALALRSYATLMSHNIRLRSECETKACRIVESIKENDEQIDFKIAITELIGYVGTPRSERSLKRIILSTTSIHVKWAAIIALGRIPSDSVLPVFLDEIKKSMKKNEDTAIDRASVSDSAWVEAALLLCISRRVAEVAYRDEQAIYENIFIHYLNQNNHVLHRYACLGLTQIENISQRTVDKLIDNIVNADAIVDSGYYALALLPTFKSTNHLNVWSEDRVSRIREKLLGMSQIDDLAPESEPDFIWSMENLADLSLEIEDNALAYTFHRALSNVFYDWRYSYYESLSAYEKAEIAIAAHRPYEYVYSRFSYANQILNEISEDDEYAMSIIGFRNTIIGARIKLLEILHKWLSSIDSFGLSSLINLLNCDVIQLYKQFLFDNDNQGISKREIECINDTVEVLTVILSIMQLHLKLLESLRINEEIVNLLSNIRVNIAQLIDSNNFSMGHIRILKALMEMIDNISLEINEGGNFENILRLMHEVSDYSNNISWTMPAHMCLLTGLGKGYIFVVNEDITGKGTNKDPFIIGSKDIDIVLSIQLEVSTGASIQTSVLCSSAENKKQQLSIVEGVAICSFRIISNVLKTNTIIPITFTLEFSTNDIVQKKDYTYFFRRCSN